MVRFITIYSARGLPSVAKFIIDHLTTIIIVSSKSKKAKVSGSASTEVKGKNFHHNTKTTSKPVYDRKGKIAQAAAFQKGEDEMALGRVQPDRRWFGTSQSVFLDLPPPAAVD